MRIRITAILALCAAGVLLSACAVNRGETGRSETVPLTLPGQDLTERADPQPDTSEPATELSTEAPTEPATEAPTEPLTEAPTTPPTEAPTEPLTEAPTTPPTEAPTEPPTEAPTEPPTEAPTEPPTEAPTEPPTEAPTAPPTEAPTEPPTVPSTAAPEPPTEATTSDSSGLWSPVPTMEADWATRAVCEAYYTNADFGFPTYVSLFDHDGDGVEDQADILQGARDYVATRPEYDPSYFDTGWPPAGRGVCTDVFAYALLAAGYDLQAMVDRDVHLRPQAYSWEVGDKNIDFRRTRNLLVFCEQYLDKYTTDPYDYAAWQPGDIVIFSGRDTGVWPGHIAIVSDRRASDGIPYLIHHTDNGRYSYEQDFLTTPQRYIQGHYRVGNLAAHTELFENP